MKNFNKNGGIMQGNKIDADLVLTMFLLEAPDFLSGRQKKTGGGIMIFMLKKPKLASKYIREVIVF
jgi:hypothetical protein